MSAKPRERIARRCRDFVLLVAVVLCLWAYAEEQGYCTVRAWQALRETVSPETP